jgi:hypothetical protein
MAKGGKTNAQMKSLGRGMAKVMNQRSGAKVSKGTVATKKGG